MEVSHCQKTHFPLKFMAKVSCLHYEAKLFCLHASLGTRNKELVVVSIQASLERSVTSIGTSKTTNFP